VILLIQVAPLINVHPARNGRPGPGQFALERALLITGQAHPAVRGQSPLRHKILIRRRGAQRLIKPIEIRF
jgi:hypothetical protein